MFTARTSTLSLALFAASLAGGLALSARAAPATQPATRAALTDAEQHDGWKLLFDGTSFAGWHGLGGTGVPEGQWEIKDGCLHCLGNTGKGKRQDLATDDKYENFDLTFEWLAPKNNGNSGVKYRVQETKGHTDAYGPEYQCMNDGDTVNKNATASLYDVLPPVGKKLAPPGEFNHSRIIVHGNHVEHWLNGVKVVEFDFGSDALKSAIAKSKFKSSPTWAKDPRGLIVLQDHNDEVYFRNLKIRELPK